MRHVRERREQGLSDGVIREKLLTEGWGARDVELSLTLSHMPESARGSLLRTFLSFEIPAWVVLGVILLASSLGLILYWYSEGAIVQGALRWPQGFTEETENFTYGSRPALSNPDYFRAVQRSFIEEKRSFIEADLTNDVLRLYEDGVSALEVLIIGKGREGSWWETPAGLYQIESKERSHFSSFGGVYQPWSMAFQGNFFIHGWPHYKDGTPTASAYSGGCIRLSNEDAKRVYERAKIGMPVLVFETNTQSDSKLYVHREPLIGASSFLVADLQSNFVFMKRESNRKMPIASITKLLTALVATEYLNLDREITIDVGPFETTSKPRLKSGERLRIYDLLFPLLLESSNEAADTLARALGKSRFVSLMNQKAEAIGMLHSHFVDPSGKSELNVSTAEDLFMLGKYIIENRSFIFKITANAIERSAYGPIAFKDLENFNGFAVEEAFLGGKVGETKEAGQTMLAIFTIAFPEDVRPTLFVVLNSPDKFADVVALRNYVQTNFEEKKEL